MEESYQRPPNETRDEALRSFSYVRPNIKVWIREMLAALFHHDEIVTLVMLRGNRSESHVRELIEQVTKDIRTNTETR